MSNYKITAYGIEATEGGIDDIKNKLCLFKLICNMDVTTETRFFEIGMLVNETSILLDRLNDILKEDVETILTK